MCESGWAVVDVLWCGAAGQRGRAATVGADADCSAHGDVPGACQRHCHRGRRLRQERIHSRRKTTPQNYTRPIAAVSADLTTFNSLITNLYETIALYLIY